MQGLEPWASCSQSRRATNCATPRYEVRRPGWAYSPNHVRYQLRYTRIFIFLPLYHGGEENQRFFCLWSFLWSKPLLHRFRQSVEIPQMQASQGFAAFRHAPSRIPPRHSQSRRATNCATPGYSVFYPAGRIHPNQARYQLRYTRIPP